MKICMTTLKKKVTITRLYFIAHVCRILCFNAQQQQKLIVNTFNKSDATQ